MILLIFYLFLALIVSFLCSIMESVLLSTPLSYLKVKEAKNPNATYFLNLKNNIDKPLSAILTLNTVAHTVGAAGVGAQAVKVFGDAYFGLVSAVLTILILVVTEIIPKTTGATYWKKLSMPVAQLIKITIFITYPLVIVSAFITKMISKNKSEYSTSREEIAALANVGTEEGIFAERENKIIQNIIKLKKIKVSQVMTPRVVVVMANEEMTSEEFLHHSDYLQFSRIPVFADSKDNITGYVIRYSVYEKLAAGEKEIKLKELKRDIVVVPDTKPVFGIWETLLERKEHIAAVIDEYGGMDGIVTMEDVLETIIGFEIVDEKDRIHDMQQYARERWKMKKTKYNFPGNLK